VVYSASWDGGADQLYMSRMDDPGARELALKDAELLSISKSGELAIRLNTVRYGGYARTGTLARVPLSGGTPREVLEYVQDADFSANGDALAVVRYVPENSHWRLEYPIGKVLFDSINWISNPKISPDGKWVAFSDHENPGGDDEGSVAVIPADGTGKEKILSSGWVSIQGVLWSPAGDEIWFTASNNSSALNPLAVTLSGKQRPITNVPGGIWLEDLSNGTALVITHQQRVGIRGVAPGGKEERELGWFGWSIPRDISRDGHKIIFEEEGNGGGANYTVFLRDTDGSPPARIGEGGAEAISPDNKWVITKPAKGGQLILVPTGAGETRTLTHDSVSYGSARYLPDGKHLVATGIETGHGRRDYMIDVSTGDSKPITPEGVAGSALSPDGRSVAVRGPDGKLGIWPIDATAGGASASGAGDASAFRPVPGLDSRYYVAGWSPDGGSLYVASSRPEQTSKVYRVNIQTGKMELWKTFGAEGGAGVTETAAPEFSADGSAYAYVYVRILSEAYVVTGLK
jgi:Tol biopolymer transport system component